MSVVIQLDKSALDRLLGGDTEVEIQLRRRVVQAFVGHHLLAVVREPAIADLINKHAAAMKAELIEHVGKEVYDHKTRRFVPEIQKYVRDHIRDCIREETTNVVGTLLVEVSAEERKKSEDLIIRYEGKLMREANERIQAAIKRIDDGLDARMDAAFEARVEREITRRLDAARSLVPTKEQT